MREGREEKRADGEADLCHVRPLRSSRIEIPAEPSSRTRCLADRAHGRLSYHRRLTRTRFGSASPSMGRAERGNSEASRATPFPSGRVIGRIGPARPSSLTERAERTCDRAAAFAIGRPLVYAHCASGFRCERSLKRAQARGAPNTVECRVHGSRERASERYRAGPPTPPLPPPRPSAGQLRLRQSMTSACEAHREEDREKRRDPPGGEGGGDRGSAHVGGIRKSTLGRRSALGRVTYGRVISPDIPTADVRAARGARGKLTTCEPSDPLRGSPRRGTGGTTKTERHRCDSIRAGHISPDIRGYRREPIKLNCATSICHRVGARCHGARLYFNWRRSLTFILNDARRRHRVLVSRS